MLILTRRAGEVIHIGRDVKVTILAITGNQVKIGFDAPRTIPVDRAEVAERKRIFLRPTGDARPHVISTKTYAAMMGCADAPVPPDVGWSGRGSSPAPPPLED